MNNTERDTHFAGFARNVIDEINGAYSEDEEIIILARRAYDLVKHASKDICNNFFNEDFKHEDFLTSVTDMPELPEEGKG